MSALKTTVTVITGIVLVTMLTLGMLGIWDTSARQWPIEKGKTWATLSILAVVGIALCIVIGISEAGHQKHK